VRLLPRLNFEIADRFFSEYLKGAVGYKSRDAKRRDKSNQRGSQPFDKGRDFVLAGESLTELVDQFNWNSRIDQASLFADWEKVVGQDSALASEPEELANGVLTVRCRSTAWATQLRLLQPKILEKLISLHPKLSITDIRFIGPTAPSWKKGPRSVPGRGPRDTYG
jgi:predicted nucleic acid-binding Zn ribbon protein